MLITEKVETGVADVDCLFAQRQGLTRSDNNTAETYEGHSILNSVANNLHSEMTTNSRCYVRD